MSIHFYLRRLSKVINARDNELRPALFGFLLFLFLFAGYFMLRPIRESMGNRGWDRESAVAVHPYLPSNAGSRSVVRLA